MTRPKVAVVGSVDEARVFDPPVPDPEGAREACEEMGREFAGAGWDLVVYSIKPSFVEADVVRGYLASGKATPSSVHVRSPFGKGNFADYEAHAEIFDIRLDPSADWEVTFYRSLADCEGVVLVGGGRSTFVTGLIAMTWRLPVLAVPGFGGAARRVWERLSIETGQSEDDTTEMSMPWQAGSAERLVHCLDRQREKRDAQARATQRREADEAKRAQVSLTVAIGLLLAAVAGLVLAWGVAIGSAASLALLALVPVLSAAAGALIRTSLDVGRDWTRAGILGAAAGLITGLLYVASQLLGAPDLLNAGHADAVRRLLLFVLPIGFIAGLTFDAIYAKLRSADVSQIAKLQKL
ncbi:MAG: hypothetical protein ABI661_11465 [Gammaproteobacteria bacterium]